MRIKLVICYDGTNYSGWQIQNNAVSVQEEIEKAIFTLTGEKVSLTGSGRTDAGVHALGQVADFSVQNSSIPPQNFAKALNTVLPVDIKVLSSCQVADDFNSRKSAKKKTYAYSFYLSDVENPLKERYATRLSGEPDYVLMQKGLDLLVGEHDFKKFNASKSGAKTTVRTIYSAQLVQTPIGFDIEVCGNGFLYNMVRIIAGLAVAVGTGKVSLSGANEMLLGNSRPNAVKTMPAKALCLKSVEY